MKPILTNTAKIIGRTILLFLLVVVALVLLGLQT